MHDRIFVIFGLDGINKEHLDIDNPEYDFESHEMVVQLNFLILRKKWSQF